MALPSNDKIIGDLGHTADHNAIVDEIAFIKENYFSASSTGLNLSEYLRKDTASATYLPISASSNYLFSSTASAIYLRRDTASATYATLLSPSFTGTPLAPTAASSTNNTQIATTAFVRTAVSNLVGAAPTTLDTLNELATALGNDPNFSTTITNSLASKLDSSTASATYLRQDSASATYLRRDTASATYLPISASSNYLRQDTASATYLRIDTASSTYATISSPVFTGIPLAPTASSNNSSNQIATTAFVADAILQVQTGSGVNLSDYLRVDVASATYYPKIINIKTASVDYTAAADDSGSLIKLDSTLPIKFIIPDNSSVPLPVGTKIDIIQTNLGQVTASAVTGVVLNSNPGSSLSGQWAAATVVKLDTNSWVIIGSIE